MKKIPLCLPSIGEEEKQGVMEVLDSGWLAHGAYNTQFEDEFKKLLGVEHAIAMNSCTSALELAVKANGITGEVVLPSFTWVASANAIVTAGAKPVFCDVDFDTRNVTAALIEPHITPQTEAVMVVHYAGQICQMDEIVELCEKHQLLLIEDSAETIGSTWKGRQAGSFGVGCFSFFPTKNITTGEGGMFTTNDAALAQKVKALIAHGIDKTTYERETEMRPWIRAASIPGHNFRMSNILAVIGYYQMLKLSTLNHQRVAIAERYNAGIENLGLDILTPDVAPGATHVYQMYTICVEANRRNETVLALREKGVGASVHFDPPVHTQKYFIENIKAGDLSNTERLCKRLITLPIYPGMSFEDVDYVIEILGNSY